MLRTTCRRFVGKVAVLSAATDGIGLAIARRLGQEKAKVVVSSRSIENVNRAVEVLKKDDIEAIGVKCHVSNAEERANLIDEAVKHFGGIDILVCNAGANPHIGNLVDCSEEAWDKTFDVNVKSTFLLTRETVPYMRKRGGGNILFMATIAGFANTRTISAYATSKICLSRLAKEFATEVVDDNIRVNCVAPGPIDTTFMNNIKVTEQYSTIKKYGMPMKRMGRPEEVAGPAAFLLSDDASYITGETIIVAGGMQSRL